MLKAFQLAKKEKAEVNGILAGYVRELICRRQYMDFRDQSNRILRDAELPVMTCPRY